VYDPVEMKILEINQTREADLCQEWSKECREAPCEGYHETKAVDAEEGATFRWKEEEQMSGSGRGEVGIMSD
jgi:hypothetical protein